MILGLEQLGAAVVQERNSGDTHTHTQSTHLVRLSVAIFVRVSGLLVAVELCRRW